jgi:hypothetical protein
MDQKRADQKSSRWARETLKDAEHGDRKSAEELGRMDKADDPAAVSVEQEASDGPEGRGLPR